MEKIIQDDRKSIEWGSEGKKLGVRGGGERGEEREGGRAEAKQAMDDRDDWICFVRQVGGNIGSNRST